MQHCWDLLVLAKKNGDGDGEDGDDDGDDGAGSLRRWAI